MAAWREAHSPALNKEEAALLPALPRHTMGGAALKRAFQGAVDTAKIQSAAGPVSSLPDGTKEAGDGTGRAPGPPRVRAALRHALRKT